MKTKRILSAVIAAVLVAVMLAGTTGAANYTAGADDLKSLGLFLGTNEGYELDRSPTRTEAAVMLVRLLGKETEAKENNFAHPFTDVPGWANPYVGYLYENGLTNGISDDEFGAADLCDGQMFYAFVLRSIGYTENGGDFTYDGAVDFAVELGLVGDELLGDSFTRDDCVYVMYAALNANIKGTNTALLDKLIADKAVDADAAGNFKKKLALVDELNKAYKTSILSTMAAAMGQPISIDFEIAMTIAAKIELEDLLAWHEGQGHAVENAEEIIEALEKLSAEHRIEITFTVTVIGEEIAIEGTIGGLDSLSGILGADITGDFAVYYKDGYIYADFMGEKIKQKIDFGEETDDMTGILSGIGIADILGLYSQLPDISAITIGGIEKNVTDNGITYTIISATGSLYGVSIDGAISLVFTPNGVFDSINLTGKTISDYDINPFYGIYHSETQLSIKINIGGDIEATSKNLV